MTHLIKSVDLPWQKQQSVPLDAGKDEQQVDNETRRRSDDAVVGLNLRREDWNDGGDDGDARQSHHDDAQDFDAA